MALKDELNNAAEYLISHINQRPKHAIFLGTGLKELVFDFEIINTFSISDIPGFPAMTVKHMDARLYLVRCEDQFCWVIGGRLHLYEGYSMEEITFPVRLFAQSGVESFFFTNAAGNINPEFKTGDMVLLQDHINWSFPSPLIGPNNPEWGPRYPGMANRYHREINQYLLDFAHRSGIQLGVGTYLGLTGPQLETPAEYRLFHRLGADMVGMSTIPEVIVAAHMNRRITALSILSNDAVDLTDDSGTDVETILKNIEKRKNDVSQLFHRWMTL